MYLKTAITLYCIPNIPDAFQFCNDTDGITGPLDLSGRKIGRIFNSNGSQRFLDFCLYA